MKNNRKCLTIQWEVISFHWHNKKGDYVVMHYWKNNFKARNWDRLKVFAYNNLKENNQIRLF